MLEMKTQLDQIEHILDNLLTSMLDALLTPNSGKLTDLQKLINEARGRKN